MVRRPDVIGIIIGMKKAELDHFIEHLAAIIFMGIHFKEGDLRA